MQSNAKIAALSLAALISFPAVSQQSSQHQPDTRSRAEVLVLGVYHMSNPGHDVFDTQVDDVLAPKRQSEMEQVIAALETFRPSKIAVEADVNNDRIPKLYADYVAGGHELSRNEVEQLGFRLAKERGHGTVYPVDVGGEFPYPRLVKYAKATGRASEFGALEEETARAVETEGGYFASHTILENLLYMNAEERVAESVGWYFRVARFGEPWDWAGADLVSDWFRRNMRIYSNILRLVDSPNERVLVIYGAGHLGWLRYAVDSNPDLRLRKLSEFAR